MSATVKELKKMIVDLRMKLVGESIPNCHCSYAYYTRRENPIDNCNDISCGECRRIFLDNMRKDIEEEVMAL